MMAVSVPENAGLEKSSEDPQLRHLFTAMVRSLNSEHCQSHEPYHKRQWHIVCPAVQFMVDNVRREASSTTESGSHAVDVYQTFNDLQHSQFIAAILRLGRSLCSSSCTYLACCQSHYIHIGQLILPNSHMCVSPNCTDHSYMHKTRSDSPQFFGLSASKEQQDGRSISNFCTLLCCGVVRCF